jgi:hypothetical protein
MPESYYFAIITHGVGGYGQSGDGEGSADQVSDGGPGGLALAGGRSGEDR